MPSIYPSKRQAWEACKEWMDKGNEISYEYQMNRDQAEHEFYKNNPRPDGYYQTLRNPNAGLPASDKRFENYFATEPSRKSQIKSRRCERERETNQFLGLEDKSIQNQTWMDGEDWRGEIRRNFRY